MDWDDFRFVQAVAQTGSVRGAGNLLKVHGSTVARRLNHLERQVGTRLFVRTPRGMAITPAGAQIIELLDRVAVELDQVQRSLTARGSILGPVSLAVPRGLAGDLVIPYLGELYRDHPDIELAFAGGPALDAIQQGRADLALWMTDDPPGDLIGRSVAMVKACVYGTPARLRTVAAGTDDAASRWVGSADPTSLSARVGARHFPGLPLGLRLDDMVLRCAALEAGLGIGLLPCHLGDGARGLARVESIEPVELGEVWLLLRPDGRGVTRVQAVSGFLQKLFLRHRRRLEGIRGSQE